MTYGELAAHMTRLDARVADIEACHGNSVYKLRRSTIRTDLVVPQLVEGLRSIMEHLGIDRRLIDQVRMPTEEEIEAES